MGYEVGDYRVKVTVKNARIMRAIEGAGYSSMASFCRDNDVSLSSLCAMVGLRLAPLTQVGEFRESASKLMAALCVGPEELWTEDQLYANLRKSSFETEVTGSEMLGLVGSHETNDIRRLEHDLDVEAVAAELMGSLSERERHVIDLRHGTDGYGRERTYEEVGLVIGCTRENVRRIEQRALRKMRGAAIKNPSSVMDEYTEGG